MSCECGDPLDCRAALSGVGPLCGDRTGTDLLDGLVLQRRLEEVRHRINANAKLLATIFNGDCTLRDRIIRCRNIDCAQLLPAPDCLLVDSDGNYIIDTDGNTICVIAAGSMQLALGCDSTQLTVTLRSINGSNITMASELMTVLSGPGVTIPGAYTVTGDGTPTVVVAWPTTYVGDDLQIDLAGDDGGDAFSLQLTGFTGCNDYALPAPPAAQVWYKCNEAGGSTLVDSTTPQEDATITAPATVHDGYFDMSTVDGGALSATVVDSRTTPISIQAWVNIQVRADSTVGGTGLSLPYPNNIVSSDVFGLDGWGLSASIWTDNGGGNRLRMGPLNGAVVDGVLTDSVWLHLLMTVRSDGGTGGILNGYVDGAKVIDEVSVGIPSGSPNGNLFVGRHNNDTGYSTRRFHAGLIDDVRFWNQELSQGEVLDLYNGGRA